MIQIRKVAALGAALLALLPSANVQAAQALASFGAGTVVQHTNNGFATAQKSDRGAFAEGNGYEFRGGVGVSAFASVTGGPNSIGIANATGKASYSDSFRVELSQVADIGSATTFLLTIPMIANGTASIHYDVSANPNLTGTASAKYHYEWSVGGVSGSADYNEFKAANRPVAITDLHTGGSQASLMVSLGQIVSLTMSASADASTLAFGTAGASAAADFSHTLRWGGVTSIVGFDRLGNQVALPTDLKLSLMSSTTGFDYANAAGPNPYTTPAVPEPATWALMIGGFAFAGGAMRKRPRAFARA